MNRDLVIGIVGSAVLVAAMVGVFFYEKNVVPPAGGDGNTPVTNATGPTVTGTVQVGKSDEKLANVTSATAKNVTFKLTWRATQGRDTLKLTVSPPTGSGITTGANPPAENDGEITGTVAVPAGASPVGDWKVKVEFTSADPGLPVTPPTNPPNTTDAQVAYTVAVTYS